MVVTRSPHSLRSRGGGSSNVHESAGGGSEGTGSRGVGGASRARTSSESAATSSQRPQPAPQTATTSATGDISFVRLALSQPPSRQNYGGGVSKFAPLRR